MIKTYSNIFHKRVNRHDLYNRNFHLNPKHPNPPRKNM